MNFPGAEGEGVWQVGDLYDPREQWASFLINALKAKEMQARYVNYIVRGPEIIIVDEFTGRTMPGRRWGDGLHQVPPPCPAPLPMRAHAGRPLAPATSGTLASPPPSDIQCMHRFTFKQNHQRPPHLCNASHGFHSLCSARSLHGYRRGTSRQAGRLAQREQPHADVMDCRKDVEDEVRDLFSMSYCHSQAVEAKEQLEIQNETITLASISYQNFFRSYPVGCIQSL